MAALQTSRNAHNLACMPSGVIRGCETTSINHAGRKGAHMKTEKVGQRIKTIMGNKGLSLAELEQRTGLKAELIRLVEEEDVYPSLGPLLKIARALGVRLGTLLDDQVSSDPLIIRHPERSQELSMLRSKNAPVALRFYSLGRGKTDRHMEPFFVELLPESATEKHLSSHEGEEFIVVHSGHVEIVYGKETYRLAQGDSIYYNSIVPHYVSCHGAATASIYAVLYFPD
jgi:transcriptional regulator with XRE-family HTH domain